ncbi:MAG: hypothetical protein A3G23_11545 [Bacteroidetes bacterium RIFCSPLOWO2_12_FULL_37_12]|nr:MAG: hypothetical protein A3G23_11545 [Bacteroidetes bacterium RIFCSPLOWO2_12_FULL_37_12]
MKYINLLKTKALFKFLFIYVFSVNCINVFSQDISNRDSINSILKPEKKLALRKILFSNDVYLEEKRQGINKLIRLSENYPKANKSFRKARRVVYYTVGGTLVDIFLYAILKEENDPRANKGQTITVNFTGLLIILPAILFTHSYNKHIFSGVEYYNNGM